MALSPSLSANKFLSYFLKLERKEKFFVLVIFGILVGLLINGMKHGSDFQVFYLAGERLLKHVSIYQADDGWMPFKYHPAWATVFAIFSLVPEKLSIVIFNCLQIAIWYWTAKIWSRLLGYELRLPSQFLILLLISLSAFSAETGYGQVNGILFLGATKLFEWLEMKPQKYLAAGFLMAIIFSLKLNFGILIMYCLIKNFRTLFGFALGLVALHLIVALPTLSLFNYHIYDQWIDLLLTQSSTQYYMFEAQGFLRFCYTVAAGFAKPLWIVMMAIFICGGFDLHRRKADPAIVGCYWIAGTYLFSPLPWWYQILYMFPVLFYLLKLDLADWQRWLVRSCLAVYALATYNTLGKQGIIEFKNWQGFFVCSAFLFFLFIFKARKVSAKMTDIMT